jgi:hypothetical protein
MADADQQDGPRSHDPRSGALPSTAAITHAHAHDHRLHNRVLRVRITDVETGRQKVGLTLPVGLVGVATRLGARLVPAGLDTPELLDTIERGELAEPVVILDEDNGERVEIALEG